jgi:hypothetical protein
MSVQSTAVRGGKPLVHSHQSFNTVRCVGPAIFRHQLARDVASLLELDDDVAEWSCAPLPFSSRRSDYRPDFLAVHFDGSETIVVADERPPAWLKDAVVGSGRSFRSLSRADLPQIRLRNCRDLLRYARFDVSLDDRVRLLAALEDQGSLTLVECLSAFRSAPPIPGLASLILNRFVSVDLDEALIGPQTTIRRFPG